MSKDKLKLLSQIYISFLKLGSMSFGGGYAMIPLIEREAVEEKKWVEKEKLVDVFAVSESLPGAIALNSSAFVGYTVAGTPGAVAALAGNLTPSVIIVLTLSVLFARYSDNPVVSSAFSGIYPVITGLILYAAYKIGKTAIKDLFCVLIMLLAFYGTAFRHLPPIPVIVAGALAGITFTTIKNVIRKAGKDGKSM